MLALISVTVDCPPHPAKGLGAGVAFGVDGTREKGRPPDDAGKATGGTKELPGGGTRDEAAAGAGDTNDPEDSEGSAFVSLGCD